MDLGMVLGENNALFLRWRPCFDIEYRFLALQEIDQSSK